MKIINKTLVSIVISVVNLNLVLANDGLSKRAEVFTKFHENNYLEQVYVHIDKRYYLTGEFIEYKVYCLEKTTSKPSQLSKIAYFEILDQNNKALIQSKIKLENGVGFGEIFIPTNINSGNFILRSYTRWMRNMGPDYYYHSLITIINPFKRLGLNPIAEPDDFAINFYPESGTLIHQVESKIVFECKNSDGYPVNFAGKLFENDTVLVQEFMPTKNGIGSFNFTPSKINDYHVELYQKDSLIKINKIPPIKENGFAIRMSENDSGIIYHLFCNDSSLADHSEQLYYIFHHKGKIIANDFKSLENGKATIHINKSKIPIGITTMSLLNSENQLLKQLYYFKYPNKKKKQVQVNKTEFEPREKISLNVSDLVENLASEHIDISISVASHHQNFTGNHISMNDYVLLSNSLKGFIYGLESFFEGTSEEINHSINNLLIAHANQDFLWQTVDTVKTVYIPECRYPIITGKITNKNSGEPAHAVYAYLSIPGKHPQFNATRSKSDGSIIFEMQNFYGSKNIIVQTDYTKDTIYDISIDNPFSEEYANLQLPALNIDKHMEGWIKQQSQNMQINNAYRRYNPKRANISETDSSMFYIRPDSRYYLDDFTRFIVMEEVMREYISGVNVRKNKQGFHFMTVDLDRNEIFYDNPLMLLDGVPVFDADEIIALDPLKVQKIETLKRRFHYGYLDCQGIVSYNTYDGDLNGYSLNKHALVLDYEGIQVQKQYNFPQYNSSVEKNITTPDFRNMLYWAPEYKFEKDSNTIEFYSSDNSNVYEITINGITTNGTSFSDHTLIEVLSSKKNNN